MILALGEFKKTILKVNSLISSCVKKNRVADLREECYSHV